MKINIKKNKNIDSYKSWPIWTCEKSRFDWVYDQEEHCFIIEGEVRVTGNGNSVLISKGDYVIFPKGLKCSWEVTKPIVKHYNFKQ